MRNNIILKSMLLSSLCLQFSCRSGNEQTSGDKKSVSTSEATEAKFETTYKQGHFPSFDPDFPPPAGTKDTFQLSQNYPDSFDVNEASPWEAIDFKTKPEDYLATVLKYCIEGNDEVDFVVQKNAKRMWYHAPWLHDDGPKAGNGREYMHGLTRERATPVRELNPLYQDVALENWAVGFYNAKGGYTIGKVWLSGEKPDPMKALFPEGTVSFKLLFTDGDTSKVPFLKDSKQWTANIYPCDPGKTPAICPNATMRTNRTVSLLQIDVAIKDKRAGTTGWVFGTFIYDATRKGTSVWDRMAPVGLMWGDDETDSTMMTRPGAFFNQNLKETYLNKNLITDPVKTGRYTAYMSHHGVGGRLNGPVDNPISSCISCHGRAANNNKGVRIPMMATGKRENLSYANFQKFFSEVSNGVGPFATGTADSAFMKTDYSLQLAAGIRNYYNMQPKDSATVAPEAKATLSKTTKTNKPVYKGLPDVKR